MHPHKRVPLARRAGGVYSTRAAASEPLAARLLPGGVHGGATPRISKKLPLSVTSLCCSTTGFFPMRGLFALCALTFTSDLRASTFSRRHLDQHSWALTTKPLLRCCKPARPPGHCGELRADILLVTLLGVPGWLERADGPAADVGLGRGEKAGSAGTGQGFAAIGETAILVSPISFSNGHSQEESISIAMAVGVTSRDLDMDVIDCSEILGFASVESTSSEEHATASATEEEARTVLGP